MPAVLDPEWPKQPFPSVDHALKEPNGLLAMGGCLSPLRLLNAYHHGIFPWFNPGEPILWWSPDPRLVLRPKQLKISRSLRKVINKQLFAISYDQAFTEVIQGCAQSRSAEEPGTWLTPEMQAAYLALHRLGFAHSVEAWRDGHLVGGLYGVALGGVFFGESMFYREANASKAAFAHLVQDLQWWGYALVDCQVKTEHLLTLGAETMSRFDFMAGLAQNLRRQTSPCSWRSD